MSKVKESDLKTAIEEKIVGIVKRIVVAKGVGSRKGGMNRWRRGDF